MMNRKIVKLFIRLRRQLRLLAVDEKYETKSRSASADVRSKRQAMNCWRIPPRFVLRSKTVGENKIPRACPWGSIRYLLLMMIAVSFLMMPESLSMGQGGPPGEDNIELSVVAVNPSQTKTQDVPITMYLPQEVTPVDIVDSAGLEVEFDPDRSIYYLYKEAVTLKPGETKTFNVEIKDVWNIPQEQLDTLREQTAFVVGRLEGSEFYESAQKLAETIYNSLDIVARTQSDKTVSRRRHIGVYRDNLNIIKQIKENITLMEKQLTLPKSLPVPEVLEQPKVKTDAPTKTTAWMIIFIIMTFMGMLAGVFFFTWRTQAHFTKDLIANARNVVFPKRRDSGSSSEEASKGSGEQP